MDFSVAVPALVNCPIPRRWMSVQWGKEASQNLTCPVVTGEVPEFTVAVSVATLPCAIVVTLPLPDVIAREVVVATEAAHAH